MHSQGCRCVQAQCHWCSRNSDGDTCRVCRDGWYLLHGVCYESCPATMSSSGINLFKRRCMSPFTCQSGRLQVEPPVNFGCKCATEGNAEIAACHSCEHRAGEYGQHCTKCNGGMYLHMNRCDRRNCDGLNGLIRYAPGNYGRECRSPFTCTDRVDGLGNACKCSRAVGKNDCSSCDWTRWQYRASPVSTAGNVCTRCTNSKYLENGVCVDACQSGSPVGTDRNGRECQ